MGQSTILPNVAVFPTYYGFVSNIEKKAAPLFFVDSNVHKRRHNTISQLQQDKVAFTALKKRYKRQLTDIDPSLFPIIKNNEKQADELEGKLLFTAYISYTEQVNKEQTEESKEHLLECANLTQQWHDTSVKETPEIQLQAWVATTEKYLKFLGLTIFAPWIINQIQAITSGKVDVIKDMIGVINERRTYVVFSAALFASILKMLPTDFIYNQQAQQELIDFSPFTSYMSWILYYVRFGINVYLLWTATKKQTSDVDKELSPLDKFKTEWKPRKFALLGDASAAIINTIRFCLLRSNTLTGSYASGFLAVGLLLLNLMLSVWKYLEENTKHNKEMVTLLQQKEQLEQELEALNSLLIKSKKEPPNFIQWEKQTQELHKLQTRINEVDKTIAKVKTDWKFKQYGLINNWTYYLGLTVAFSLMCCFFVPPSAMLPTTNLIMRVIGSAMCFVFNIANSAITSQIEISKLKDTHQQNLILQIELLSKLMGTTDETIKKQLYLERAQLLTKSHEQKSTIEYQSKQLTLKTYSDSVGPTLLFAALVFMPAKIGLPVFIAYYVLLKLMHQLLGPAPQATHAIEFDEQIFKAFNPQEELEKNTVLLNNLYPLKKQEKSAFTYQGTNPFGYFKKAPESLSEEHLDKNKIKPDFGS